MSSVSRPSVLALVVSAALAPSLIAQAPEFRIRPADANLAHEFTRIGSVRELADGRLLIGDDDAILIADLRSGRVRRFDPAGLRRASFWNSERIR